MAVDPLVRAEYRMEPVSASQVLVHKHDGKKYTVHLDQNGRAVVCTCVGFGYRHTCRHLDMVSNALTRRDIVLPTPEAPRAGGPPIPQPSAEESLVCALCENPPFKREEFYPSPFGPLCGLCFADVCPDEDVDPDAYDRIDA
jgi:hypothetical protein